MIVEAKPLAVALSAGRKIAPANGGIPILSNALISAADGRMTICATDLDMWIEHWIPSDDDLPETTVPVHVLSDIARTAKTENLDIAMSGDDLIVKSGRSRFTLRALGASDWPKGAAGHEWCDVASAGGVAFTSALKSALDAVDEDRSRPFLCGVRVRAEDRGAVFVGFNGTLLIRIPTDIRVEADRLPLTIPMRAAQVIVASMARSEHASMQVRDDGNMLCFTGDGVRLTCKMLSADGYPDDRRLEELAPGFSVRVDRDALISAIERALITSDRQTTLNFRIGGGAISVESRDVRGDARIEIEAATGGEAFVCALGRQIVTAATAACPDGGEVGIGIGEHPKPIVFSGTGARAFVSPLRPRYSDVQHLEAAE